MKCFAGSESEKITEQLLGYQYKSPGVYLGYLNEGKNVVFFMLASEFRSLVN